MLNEGWVLGGRRGDHDNVLAPEQHLRHMPHTHFKRPADFHNAQQGGAGPQFHRQVVGHQFSAPPAVTRAAGKSLSAPLSRELFVDISERQVPVLVESDEEAGANASDVVDASRPHLKAEYGRVFTFEIFITVKNVQKIFMIFEFFFTQTRN